MKTKIGIIIALLVLCCLSASADAKVIYQSTFDQNDRARWSGWSTSVQTIDFVPDACDGLPAMKITVPESVWNCPIITFSNPIVVTENTVIRFKIKCVSGRRGMIIKNQAEDAEYYLSYVSPSSTEWVTVQMYLAGASYKRFGKADVPKNGLLGDPISSVMVTSGGKEVWIGDFQIYEADKPVVEIPEEEPIFKGTYSPIDYPNIKKFFPFGVIFQAGAGTANGALFGQSRNERYEQAISDLKHHYMNTFANFCDDGEVDSRMNLCHKYNMQIIETRLTGSDLASVSDTGQFVQMIKKYSGNKQLLAWYGQADEPTDFKYWIDYKIAINKLDPNHPVASCLNDGYAAKVLRPYSELLMLDIYSVMKESKGVAGLVSHADSIRMAKKNDPAKKVWLVTQAYGDRGTFRYPTPEEVRFDVFNAISAGANGIAFFIYNDVCSYLSKPADREKFDYTLSDPWFNDNATYRELSRLGRDVIPIMPSMMVARETSSIADRGKYAKGGLVYSKFDNSPGTFVVIVNMSLDSRYLGSVEMPHIGDQQVYDLVKLVAVKNMSERSLSVNLSAGEGGIYLIASPKAWKKIRAEILARKLNAEIELLESDSRDLKCAKLNTSSLDKVILKAKRDAKTGKLNAVAKSIDAARATRRRIEISNPNYESQKKDLENIRADFAAMHGAILSKIELLDGTTDPTWMVRFEKIRKTSRDYFRLRREWANGNYSNRTLLSALRQEVVSLKDGVTAGIRK